MNCHRNVRTIGEEKSLLCSGSSGLSLSQGELSVVDGGSHSPFRDSHKPRGHLPQYDADIQILALGVSCTDSPKLTQRHSQENRLSFSFMYR